MMIYDQTIDAVGLSIEKQNLNKILFELHKGFETSIKPEKGFFQNVDPSVDENISRIVGIENTDFIAAYRPQMMISFQQMLNGVEINGSHTLGLKEINSWHINPEYSTQNIKQQSGYAAEVISTWKENWIAASQHSDIRTYRADDLPELFPRNDQYVDKVRINSAGEIVERIQTKFVGGNGEEWLNKVLSKDYDKYFDGHIDKLECPKNYYDDVKSSITERRASYEKQLEHVLADGKTDVAEKLQQKINKLDQLNTMVEKSTVSTDEAIYARQHPKMYAAKMFAAETIKAGNVEGLKGSVFAAGLTFTVSTVDNISSYVNGEISAKDMVLDVVEDTAAAGALGYGTAFVSTAVAQTMRASSVGMINSIGNSCLPVAAVSFAVQSYDDISDYAQGKIDGTKLAYNLGENATMVAAGLGGAKVGAAIGSVVGPAGTVVGGVVGGLIGCAVASEAYETAIEYGAEGAQFIADKVTEYAQATVAAVSEFVPDAIDSVKEELNSFLSKTHINFRFSI